MRILYAAATVTAISASAGLITVLGCRSSVDEKPARVLVENQRLRAENGSLVQESVRLSTENENLQERLNELLIEGAGQETLALENVRLTADLQRAQRDLDGKSARREELQEASWTRLCSHGACRNAVRNEQHSLRALEIPPPERGTARSPRGRRAVDRSDQSAVLPQETYDQKTPARTGLCGTCGTVRQTRSLQAFRVPENIRAKK